MKTVSEIIAEAVEVSTSEYENSHGKPRGSAGGWMFGRHRSVDFDKHKEGEDYITVNGVHTYGEAKKKAKQWAASKGHRLIHVLPESYIEALDEEVDYDRHFSRQSKEVQTKINHHLRQGADYPTAARKAGATALKVGKMNEGVVARAGKIADRVVGPAGSARRQAANVTADAGSMATGMSSGEIAAPGAVQLAAQKAGMRRTANVAKFVGQADTLNSMGRAAARGLSRVAPRATSGALGTVAKGMLGKAGPLAMAGLAAYDAYKGYNSNPNASTSQKLKNAGINALSGLTFGASEYATGGMKESTTHGNGKMKTLTQFMAEANASYVEEQEELSPEMQAIFDAINEAVGDRELSEEEFNEIFNYVVENLEDELEEQDDDELDEATTAQDYLKNLPKKPGGGLKTLPYPIKPGQKPSGGIKKLPYPIKPGEKPAAKLAPLEEAHDIELKPHPNGKGTHFVVHKINDKSIGKDQLKAGETVNDSHVDDLKDMGYSVKIHD